MAVTHEAESTELTDKMRKFYHDKKIMRGTFFAKRTPRCESPPYGCRQLSEFTYKWSHAVAKIRSDGDTIKLFYKNILCFIIQVISEKLRYEGIFVNNKNRICANIFRRSLFLRQKSPDNM